MEISKIILICLFVYYSGYISRLIIVKSNRDTIQSANKQLDVLRSKPCKTLEEQKEFLDIKFPRTLKKVYFHEKLLSFIKTIVFYIPFIFIYHYIFNNYIKIPIPLYIAILIIIILPMIINYILKKYNLEKDDISIYLKGKWFDKKK
jgi:hypothetical protein